MTGGCGSCRTGNEREVLDMRRGGGKVSCRILMGFGVLPGRNDGS